MINTQKINNIVNTTSDELKSELTLEVVKEIVSQLVEVYKIGVSTAPSLDELIENSRYANNESFISIYKKYIVACRTSFSTDEENIKHVNNISAFNIISTLSKEYRSQYMETQ